MSREQGTSSLHGCGVEAGDGGFILWGRGSKGTGYFNFYDDGVVVIRGDENIGEGTEKSFHIPNNQSQ